MSCKRDLDVSPLFLPGSLCSCRSLCTKLVGSFHLCSVSLILIAVMQIHCMEAAIGNSHSGMFCAKCTAWKVHQQTFVHQKSRSFTLSSSLEIKAKQYLLQPLTPHPHLPERETLTGNNILVEVKYLCIYLNIVKLANN